MEYLLPLAITFGMPTTEFWNEDPDLLWAYRSSYMQKLEIESEKINYVAWLNGLYVYEGVSVALSYLGKSHAKYPEKPHDLKPKTEAERRMQVANEVKRRLIDAKALLDKQKQTENGR
jgi:hypothetical protein